MIEKSNLPHFPLFKTIVWEDRHIVSYFTRQFPPYSDFNFVSIWSWNVKDKMMISQLNGNLVILFYDYISDAPFISFLGQNCILDTVTQLVHYSKNTFGVPELKLIPEFVAKDIVGTGLEILSDIDSHDYILSVSYLSCLDILPSNSNFAARICKKFLSQYSDYSVQTDFASNVNVEQYADLFKLWAEKRNYDHSELNEFDAFLRYISNKETENIILSIFIRNRLVGFVAYEVLAPDYSICHFTKADDSYTGVYYALLFHVGKELQKLSVTFFNFEQDLGIPGLRQSKRKFKPEFYLKKFIVREVEDIS